MLDGAGMKGIPPKSHALTWREGDTLNSKLLGSRHVAQPPWPMHSQIVYFKLP